MAVARVTSKPFKMPYEVFVIGLDRLYTMPFSDEEDVHSRCLAIDRYIDSNGWSWDALTTVELDKLKIYFDRN